MWRSVARARQGVARAQGVAREHRIVGRPPRARSKRKRYRRVRAFSDPPRMLPPAAPPMTPLNLSKPKTLEEMIAETNTKEHWDERGGAYAFVIIVPVAIGILMLVARRLDSKTHRASPHSGCQAVIAMAGDWEKQGVCWRMGGPRGCTASRACSCRRRGFCGASRSPSC